MNITQSELDKWHASKEGLTENALGCAELVCLAVDSTLELGGLTPDNIELLKVSTGRFRNVCKALLAAKPYSSE